MRKIIFENDALDQFSDWGLYDRQRFAKIYDLIKDIRRTPFEGKGKPEALKYIKGCWSRRIDDTHRLIYRIAENGDIQIVSCKGHYGDR